MKLNLSPISFLFLFLCLSCSNNITDDAYEYCDLTQPNSGFNEAELGMPFSEVKGLISAGTVPAGGFLNAKMTEARYLWTYCGYQYEIYIQCEFSNDRLTFMEKTFRDTMCSSNINSAIFDEIEIGDSYEKTVALLASDGDLMEIRSLEDNEVFTKYIWYDCFDTYRYIEARFINDILQKKIDSF